MNKKFIRLITVICASLLMICAVCITAWADQVPATRTDLSPNEEEIIVAESQEMIITKSLKMGASWEGKANKNKPVILKLDLEKNQNVNLLIEGNHVQVKVQKSDRLEETVCKATTKPNTKQATLSWPGKTGSYLITVSPEENSLMIKAKLSFMDDEAFTAWKETQTAEEQIEEETTEGEQTEKEQTVEPTEETPAGEPEGEQAQEPAEDPEGTPKGNPTEDQPEQSAGSEEPITDEPEAEEPADEDPTEEKPEEAEKENEPTEDEPKEPTEEGTEPWAGPETEPGTDPEDGTEPETENKPESGETEPEIEPKTEEEADQPELPPDRSARITLTWDTDHPRLGDIGHFRSILIGYDDLTYTLQWQTSWDEKEWTDFEGATGPELDVELTRELDGIYFRLMVYVETEQE